MSDAEVDAMLEEEHAVLSTIMKGFEERLSSIPGCLITTYVDMFSGGAVCYTAEAILKLYLRESGNSRRDQMYLDLKKHGHIMWGRQFLKLIDTSLMLDTFYVGSIGFSLNNPDTFENIYDCIFNNIHDTIALIEEMQKSVAPKDIVAIRRVSTYMKQLLAKEYNRIVNAYSIKYNRKLEQFEGV
jgi:hypothetical protein